MISLPEDLQLPKNDIDEFGTITKRVLQYLPNVLSGYEDKNGYRLYTSRIAENVKYTRPINIRLFIYEESRFQKEFNRLKIIFKKIKSQEDINETDKNIINKTIYTIQQSIGVGLDLLVQPNSARKHVGNRFEELIKALFTALGISNKRIVLKIPYETDEGTKTYKCENDLILSPYSEVKSTPQTIDPKEIVVSAKTTSKDRMGKMFIDKLLLERFVGHPQKVIGIFLNDVQRKDTNNISYTLVSGLFMVYSKFLTQLEGIYYLDPPPNAKKKPYSNHMKPFNGIIA